MEIRTIIRDGVEKTAISIGPDDATIPAHLLQGIKKDGIIIAPDGSRKPWLWDGMCSIDGTRYVYFPRCELEGISVLTSTRRSSALALVRQAAMGLMDADREFLDLVSGVFPLYRIYVYDRDSILLLPPDLADVFAMMGSDEDRRRQVTAVIRGNAEQNFMLITEMAELLYYAASGVFPFASDAVRGSGYKEVPISFYASLPEKTEGFINFIFHAKDREMREIMGNRDGGENLSWFLSRSEDLEWTLGNRTEEEMEKSRAEAESSEEYRSFFERREKITKRNSFWRVKGAIIIASAVIAIGVGIFLWSYIGNILEPPETADLDQRGVIEAFYDAQSDCDTEALTTALKGCSAPQEMEVTNLYVTSRTRMAYESIYPLVNAEEWLEAGKPDIPETSYIYGVILESIEETGENEYIASGIWYTPFPEDEADTAAAEPGKTLVYKYRVTQTFSFTWNDRGWWNITDTDITGYEFLGTESVGTYSALDQR